MAQQLTQQHTQALQQNANHEREAMAAKKMESRKWEERETVQRQGDSEATVRKQIGAIKPQIVHRPKDNCNVF
jgi:hypothetical protein